MSGNNKKSFTLVELLIAIAVIGILAAVVLVSISSARNRTRIAKAANHSAQIYHALAADVIGNWEFEDGSGSSVSDRSGLGNTGNFSGADWSTDTPDGQGSALNFDGSGFMTVTNNALRLSNDFTISGWFKSSASSQRTGVFAQSGGGGFVSASVISSNAFSVETMDSNGGFLGLVAGGKNYHDGQWHFFAVSRDDTNNRLHLYVDGARIVSGNDTRTGNFDFSSSAYVGKDTGYNFIGSIDDVRIYNKALTD